MLISGRCGSVRTFGSFKYLKSRTLRHIQLEWRTARHSAAIGHCSSCDKQTKCFYFMTSNEIATPIYPFHKNDIKLSVLKRQQPNAIRRNAITSTCVRERATNRRHRRRCCRRACRLLCLEMNNFQVTVIQNGSNRSQSTSSVAHLWPHQCFVIHRRCVPGVPSLSRVNDTFEFVECIKMKL